MRELRECRCRQCRRGSPYRQRVMRAAKKRLRSQTKQQLARLNDLQDFSKVLIGVGYTD